MKKWPVLAIAADLEVAQFWPLAEKLRGLPVVLKVGLRLLPYLDAQDWKKLKDMKFSIFVDAKLHDIPTQVSAAVKSWADKGADYLTLHLSGASKMLEEAQKVASSSSIQLLGVSVLTSLNEKDLQSLGFSQTPFELVSRWIQLGWKAGIKGFVLSAAELKLLRDQYPEALWCTPGLRLSHEAQHSDQQRSVTVEEALSYGSQLLVVGRSITQAADPEKTVKDLLKLLES